MHVNVCVYVCLFVEVKDSFKKSVLSFYRKGSKN